MIMYVIIGHHMKKDCPLNQTDMILSVVKCSGVMLLFLVIRLMHQILTHYL